MIRGSDFNIRKILLSLIYAGISFSAYSQGHSIGGVINEYMDVVAIGADNVTLSDAAVFNAGDTVLLIQMKGVVINGPENSAYGSYQYGTPGIYEFLIIQSIGSNNVVFTRNLFKTYDVSGNVQLIKVPSFNSAEVTSELTCLPWDSVTTKTGGVVALIVGGTLTLDADINVNGKGLIGGFPFIGDGICLNTNTLLYNKYAYPGTYTNSGFKGESLVSRAYLSSIDIPSIYPDFAKGLGANFTGGGGGNGRFSGGGGGAGSGFGGIGGRENASCGPPGDGGQGGKQVINTVLEGNILLGGGGGSSTSESGSTAIAGGRGGGIIIIVCDTLKSNGIHNITANGESAAQSVGNAGAGGGGGAGTLALYQKGFSLQNASSELKISVNGGNGGNTVTNSGEGGGGGGGLIFTNTPAFPIKIDTSSTPGLRGSRGIGQRYSENGKYGKVKTDFIPILNGFLFNTIRSSVSLNQIDSVCSNMKPPMIVGTKPTGGSGTYTIIWQKSFEPTFSSPVVLANDTDPINYTPTLADAVTPTDTVWFRRIVLDTGTPVITDISKALKIIVHPGISNNNVGTSDTICYNDNPPLIHQLLPDLIVPSTSYLFYSWQDSSGAGTWGSTIGSVKEYDPPALLQTTKYRRIVTSGSCVSVSPSVDITVLPKISGNLIFTPADDSICSGMQFPDITGTKQSGTTPVLDGGDNLYKFRWESNNNYTGGWVTADGISNADNYLPVTLPERIPWNDYVFRRIVFSGSNDVCSDTSNIVNLKDFPKISSNDIFPLTQTICSGSVPAMVAGNLPNNGNNFYTWQDSASSTTQWTDIVGSVKIEFAEDYQPPVLSNTTSYRRIAFSSGCSDTSNSIKITVLAPIGNNIISLGSLASDTIVCTGPVLLSMAGTSNPSGGAGGPFTYQWLYRTASTNFTDVAGATQPDYNPGSFNLNTTTYYKRQVTDLQSICRDTSSSMISVNVLPPISNNIVTSSQPAVCENTLPEPISGAAPAGGSGSYIYFWEQSTDGGANWDPAGGINTLINYQPPKLSSPIQYRRRVTSGLADCCTSTSPALDISINPAPDSPVNAGEDAFIHALDQTYYMNADPPVIAGESGFWSALEPAAAIIVDATDSKTEVKNLSPTERNLFVWTITNGLCNLEDSVYVELLANITPQGISPNGDNLNNTFIIQGLNLSDRKIAELNILNGAGTVVFSTTNRNGQQWVDWDGKNNKGVELPDGTYYYLFKFTTEDKKVIKESGFIELKRR